MVTIAQPYTDYRSAGLPEKVTVPAHWDVAPLKQVAIVLLSNVDKLSDEQEQPVLLCNYVDVYKNDFITNGHSFMQATAKPGEIERFELRRGDVLITKDSESWDDIGVPALIVEDLPGVLCGYHLAMLRPFAHLLDGAYLYWALESRIGALQFHSLATGVTRFGISKAAVKNVLISLPPLEEQIVIANYLRHAQKQVSCVIRNKRRLIALLNEEKQAIIQQAVTRGLNPDVPMKPSGVEWLGEIPAHWEVRRLKWLFNEIDDRTPTGDETLLSLRMYRGLVPHNDVSDKAIPASAIVGYKIVRPGQVVMNRMQASNGLFAIADQRGVVSPDYSVFQSATKDSKDSIEYLVLLFRTSLMRAEFRRFSKGLGTGTSGFLRLYGEQFGRIAVPLPAPDEQLQVVSEVRTRTSGIDAAIARVTLEVDLIREYRTRLIADVVTGQLDVRSVQSDDAEWTIEELDSLDAEGLAEGDMDDGEIEEIIDEEEIVA